MRRKRGKKLLRKDFDPGAEMFSKTRRALLHCLIAAIIGGLSVPVAAQAGKPGERALEFYRALKARQYLDGFRRSVYRKAVEGLSPDELKDLEPDFSRTFSEIPDKIEVKAEKIDGDSALVALKFEGSDTLQQVALIKSGGEWLVGDKETLDLVNQQGKAFFFNTRITVNEAEAYEMLQRMVGAEYLYAKKFQGQNATLDELIKLGGVPRDLEDGTASGYRFSLELRPDKSAFYARATPITYGKTGRVSLYADINGIRGADLKGKPAGPETPAFKPQ
jgi:hypothetical protein